MNSQTVALIVIAVLVTALILGLIAYAIAQEYEVKGSIKIPFVKGAIELRPSNKK
ncbi:hypothetical protein [Vogesella indigofera]|uniref:hypothetical protein n=1 Tax=Vogesella indigofera TaxID=45465 RepID=UPI00234EE5D6|nr:hypothetical protein [Vogesella indigofera]MDC7698002.1 hypothetical protein [Vogesella indigofera]